MSLLTKMLTAQKAIDFSSVFQHVFLFESLIPCHTKESPQSIEIAGFSLHINAFGHFLLSANAENILYLRK